MKLFNNDTETASVFHFPTICVSFDLKLAGVVKKAYRGSCQITRIFKTCEKDICFSFLVHLGFLAKKRQKVIISILNTILINYY